MKAELTHSTAAPVGTVSSGATLGERVRVARRAAGLSQARLAGEELTKGFISQIESDLVKPSIRSLQLIAGRLGRPLDYFLGDEPLAEAKRADFHRLAAEAAIERSDWATARTHALTGLLHATEPLPRAALLRLVASAAVGEGRFEEAFERISEGLALVDVDRDPLDHARLLYVRGSAYQRARQLVASVETFEALRDVIERHEITDPRLRARTLIALGLTYRRLGRTTKAVAAYESALAVASRANDLRSAALGYMGVAVSQYDAGELDSSIVSYERALQLFERVSDVGFELNVRQSLAAINFEQGRVPQARELADRTVARAVEVGDDHWVAVAQVVRARVFLHEGHADEARRIAKQAERVLAAAGDQIQRADALRVMAAACEAMGEVKDADRLYKQALDALSALDDRADLAPIATEYARALRARGDVDAAFAMLELASAKR